MEALKYGRLTTVRFAKITAETGSENTANGGSVLVEVRAGLKPSTKSDIRAIGHVGIKLTGLPEGKDDENQFAFRIEVVVHGSFEWEESKDIPNLKNPSVVQVFCQNLYTMGTLEVQTLADRLGFSNVTIPWQLNTSSNQTLGIEKKRSTKPRSARTDVVQRVRKPREQKAK